MKKTKHDRAIEELKLRRDIIDAAIEVLEQQQEPAKAKKAAKPRAVRAVEAATS